MKDSQSPPSDRRADALSVGRDAEPSAVRELKPCPFCGGEASSTGQITYSEKHEAWWNDGTRVRSAFFVNCVACSIDNKGFIGHQTPTEAIAAWNRRAEPGWQPISSAPRDGTEAEPTAEVWLRDVGGICPSDGQWDECWVPCAKGDHGARLFIYSGER